MAAAPRSSLNFPKRHEVVGYGRVEQAGRGLEKRIEVLVRPAERGAARDLASSDTPDAIWIGCGQLDCVTIGSCWVEGDMVGRVPADRCMTRSLSFKASEPLDPWIGDLEEGAPIRLGDMPCYHLTIEALEGRLTNVWVPVLELARALFGVSSHLLVQMFSACVYRL